MFAGFATGGIPGSGTDRSAIGPATGQVAAGLGAGLEAERTGETRTALDCDAWVGAGAAECEAGRKITAASATTATTATDTPPNHTRRLARGSAASRP